MMRKRMINTCLVSSLCLLSAAASDVVADEPPENATSRYLGAEADRAGVSIVLQAASPLFGGREYYISGEGRIVIVDIRRRPEAAIVERRFEIEKANAQTDEIIRMIRDADLLSIPLERKDRPRASCSTSPLFLMRNAAGTVRSLPLTRGAQTKAYEDICMAIAKLMKLTRDKDPVYEGDYDTKFTPNQFEWTIPILLPGKDIRWAPKATAADIEKAEQEYLKKVEIQLKQLELDRQKEAEKRESPNETPKSDDENKPDAETDQ